MPIPTAVLRRDRIIVVLALTLLTGMAWSYLMWLAADMSMGGMDMTGFRVIPSGMGLMMPAQMPWRAMEFAFVFAMWAAMMCLTQCQKPFAFLMRQRGFRRDALGSLMLGVRHGAYCVGCCWALMALLLVGGVMNMVWIILLALFILGEKVAPFGR